jgi:hypothetical protein
VCQDTGDVGAFYVGRDWTSQGIEIRYNYWHDIFNGREEGWREERERREEL